MDQRLIDVNDPTSYGGDLIQTNGEDSEKDEVEQDDTSNRNDVKNEAMKGNFDVTIITEDVDWGDRGKGKPILLQHGHHLDAEQWFDERGVGKPIPL